MRSPPLANLANGHTNSRECQKQPLSDNIQISDINRAQNSKKCVPVSSLLQGLPRRHLDIQTSAMPPEPIFALL